MPKGGHMPGRFAADIAVESQAGATVTYRATLTKGKAGAASLWVMQKCYDENGVVVAAANNPVVGSETGSGVTEPFATTGVRCTAYVWVFPDAFDPISETLEIVP